MKKILSILIAVAALLALPAMAQIGPIYSPQAAGGAFYLAGASATNLGYVIDCRKQNYVCVQMTGKMSSSATDAITWKFQRSVDGVNYALTADTFAYPATGTTVNTQYTNLPTCGAGYIKILYCTNAAATDVWTNTSVVYGVKIQAP